MTSSISRRNPTKNLPIHVFFWAHFGRKTAFKPTLNTLFCGEEKNHKERRFFIYSMTVYYAMQKERNIYKRQKKLTLFDEC
jgi:hypothetical protein